MYAELVLPSGRTVLIEGESPQGPQDVGFDWALSAEELRDALTEFGASLLEPLAALSCDELELELSLGLEVGTGRLIAFLASGKADTGLKLRVLWKNSG